MALLGGVAACERAADPQPIRFASEEAYLVHEVSRTMGRWMPGTASILVEAGADPGAGYSVTLGGRTVQIQLDEAVWEPAAYLPLVEARPRSEPCVAQDWLSGLLTPTPSNLLAIDQDLSRRLRATPDDPCLHEAAALLVGVFAAREYPGLYYDLRASLSRMTGHLALAHARGAAPGSVTRRIAEALLLTLSWRQAELPARIAQLTRDDPSPLVARWARVLSLFSLQDFREIEGVGEPSRLELLAGGLAIAMKAHPKRVVTFIEQHGDAASDWPRIAHSRSGSVETCNAFDESGVESVLAEAELVLGASRESDRLLDRLNEEGEGDQPAVLGAAAWAAFEQRSLMTVLWARNNCYRYWYGLKDRAAADREEIVARYSRVRLAPFLLNQTALDKAASGRAVAAAVELVQARPELVTWSNWSYIPWDEHHGKRAAGLPEEAAWFKPLLPRGTAFDYNRRFYSRHVHRPGVPLLEQAHRQVQHALATRLWIDGKFGADTGAARRRELYGQVAAFDRDALLDIARAAEDKEPAEELRARQELCELLPEDCDQWAETLRKAGDEARAAQVFEQWAAVGEAVTVANRIDWAVEYLRSHGQVARAERLAFQAASTGSARGLATLGTFLEKIGRVDAAHESFAAIAKRYDNPTELVAFASRHDGVPRYRKLKDELVAEAFPGGLRRVSLADLTAADISGAEVARAPAAPELEGLKVGDVVGAVDGLRVTTLGQLRVARSLSAAKESTVLLWRQGRWVEVRLPRAAFAATTFRD